MINDKRKSPTEPWGYMVATDKCMSGWGQAPGRSLFALAVHTPEQREAARDRLEHRSEMIRVRFNLDLPRLREGDHLSINDIGSAPSWYEPVKWN